MTEIIMPRVGQTVDELTITSIKVAPGDIVKRGDVLFEVETDKAVLPVESCAAGKVVKILYAEGDIVRVGEVCMLIGAENEPVRESAAPSKIPAPTAPASPSKVPAPAAPVEPLSRTPVKAAEPNGHALASPAARKLLRDASLPIESLRGEYAGKIIKVADAARAIEARRDTRSASAAAFGVMQTEVIINGLREYLDRLGVFSGSRPTVGDFLASAAFKAARRLAGLSEEKFTVWFNGGMISDGASLLRAESVKAPAGAGATLEIYDYTGGALTSCVKQPGRGSSMALTCGRAKPDGTATLTLTFADKEDEAEAFLTLISLYVENPALALAL